MKAFISILVLVLAFSLSAQNTSTKATQPKPKTEKARVALLARAYSDSIVLRFAPSNYQTWLHCNQTGLVIERYRILENGKPGDRKKEILTPKPLKPLPEAQWKPYIKPGSPVIAYYGCLFQKETGAANNSVAGMVTQVQNEDMRHGMAMFAADQSVEVSLLAGLRFTDKNVRKSDTYLYRIYPASPKAGYPIDTGLAYLSPSEFKPLPIVPDLKAEFKNRLVELNWEIKYLNGIYSAYQTEISSDGKNWKKSSKRPIVGMRQSNSEPDDRQYYQDSIPENGKWYSFRVRGINAFGELGPPSDTVRGMGAEPPLSIFPVIKTVTPVNDGTMLLQWVFPDSAHSRFDHFELLRSDYNSKTKYEVLNKNLPITSRSFVDTKPRRIQYYVLRAYDKANRVGTSYPILASQLDSIPPAIPSGISGKIDSSGVVKLSWKMSKEEDLLGYRIFRGNNLKEEFVAINGHALKDSVFIDTVNVMTLSTQVHYKIISVDQNYNYSDFSKVYTLKRPDLIPPSAPIFKELKSTPAGIQLYWVPSSSKDVVLHVLYRKSKGQKTWITHAVIDTSEKNFIYTDQDVKPGEDYEYLMIAVDHSKLESAPMNPVFIHHFDAGSSLAPEKLKVIKNENTLELTWKFQGAASKYEVYRGINGESPRFYRFTEGSNTSFVDQKIIPGTKYSYVVRAVLENSKTSPISDVVTIEY